MAQFGDDNRLVKLLIDGFGRDLPGSIRSEKVSSGEKATRSKARSEIALEGESK